MLLWREEAGLVEGEGGVVALLVAGGVCLLLRGGGGVEGRLVDLALGRDDVVLGEVDVRAVGDFAECKKARFDDEDRRAASTTAAVEARLATRPRSGRPR